MVLVLNWWMLFTWHDFGPWSFDAFLLIVLWAVSFYMLAIALYPPEEIAGSDVPVKYFWFHRGVVATVVLDVLWRAIRASAGA